MATTERDQLRNELMSRSVVPKSTPRRRRKTPDGGKELKILAKIHQRLSDLKLNAAKADNEVKDGDEQDQKWNPRHF